MFGYPSSSSFSPFGYSAPPPRRQTPQPQVYYSPFGFVAPSASPYDEYAYDAYNSYNPYSASAARRAALERQAAIEEQQRQAALQQRRQQQHAEEEYYRRLALQQAIEEEEAKRYRAAVKAAREEERKRREAIERRQAEILKQRQEEHRRQRAQETYRDEDDEINPFLSWFGPRVAARQPPARAPTPAPAPAPPSAPIVESVRSASPTPEANHPTVEDVTNNSSPSSPSNTSATPGPSADQMEAAATTLQEAFRRRQRRHSLLTKLATLSAELDAKRDAFALPDHLDFQPLASSSAQPKLAYTSTNAPFLGFEDSLLKLLTQIDEVQSGGDREIKKARKTLVSQIEAELAALDAHKEKLGKEFKQATAASADSDLGVTGAVPTPAAEAETSDEADADGQSSGCETESTISVDSIDAHVAMMEDLLTVSRGHKTRRDGRAHSQKKRVPRKSRKHRAGL